MNIVVLVKQTPDTETKPKIAGDGKSLETGDVKWVMNPYDEFAVEEALKTKEKAGGEVTVISVGPDRCVETIRTALAMGADKGVQVWDDSLAGADPYVTANVLAAAIKSVDADVVFAGKQAIDDDAAQTMSRVAEILDVPQANIVVSLEITGDGKGATCKAQRRVEGGEEVLEFTLPALISAEKGLNEPRYASLPGIMKAKKKPFEKKSPADLGADAAALSVKQQVVEASIPEQARRNTILDGEVPAAAAEMVRLLREEAKVI
ncbi:MAG: electron transfer flavoprotein subunit beta/FixA family protein [Chrysiogenetes bacterium]|nr:electron transfer flavoprotein subunit beta/FixA family protein [Chrysiogenetes bacterium]